MTRVFSLLAGSVLSLLLAACGAGDVAGTSAVEMVEAKRFPNGQGGAGSVDPNYGIGGFGGPRWNGGPSPAPGGGGGPVTPPTVPTESGVAGRVEETDASVTFSGAWEAADPRWGWSGGSARKSASAGASVSFTFTGTSVRWIGSKGRNHGIAQVSLDGVVVKEVDLFGRPTDEAHMPIVTLYDLANTRHTLTITVTGRHNSQSASPTVTVDAFDVNPQVVSHWQDSNPGLKYSAGWKESPDGGYWSGGGVSNLPELPMTAHEATAAGETLTMPFRGTGISVIGYRGPDAGIARIQVDGGTPTEVDLYSPTRIWQPIIFTLQGLPDVDHTLTVTATGRRNVAATDFRVVVDAFDVYTPGRRYEDYEDSKITYVGNWTRDNLSRPWSEGMSATSNVPGATASFTFTGTSVSWISCQKGSAGGTARVSIDGVFVQEVRNSQSYPIEGYQMTVFRKDGLSPGAHTLTLEVTNTNGAYVVVDAFDVRP